MKTFLFLFAILALTACSGKREILTERIQYDVTISNEDPDLDWWVNNMEGSKREPFLKEIFDKVFSGEIRSYDYFNAPYTPEEVRLVGNDTIFQTLQRLEPPYDEYDTTIVTSITYKDVTRIRFMEEWQINKKNMQITKKVIGMAPVYVRKYGQESFNQVLFWIYFDEKYPEQIKAK